MSGQRSYRYYDFVMAAFVTVLICSNLIGPAKIVQPDWLPFAFGAGVLFFPISYVFGDILTEVYGYSRARRVIWAGFAGLAFASIMAAVVVALPLLISENIRLFGWVLILLKNGILDGTLQTLFGASFSGLLYTIPATVLGLIYVGVTLFAPSGLMGLVSRRR